MKLPDGTNKRIFGTPTLNTKNAAIDAEREHVQRDAKGEDEPTEKTEVPTFDEWFNGRFWREWVDRSEEQAERSGGEEERLR